MEPDERRWWEKRRSYLVTPKATQAEVNEALREDWARGRVAAAGKSWTTHMAKFSGTVLPRPREVVARSETPSDAADRMAQTLGRALRPGS